MSRISLKKGNERMDNQNYFEKTNRLRCCRTLIYLIKRETLPDGIMPKWITKMVNWTING